MRRRKILVQLAAAGLTPPLQAVLEKLFAHLSSQAATIARLEAGAVHVSSRLDKSEPALAALRARVEALQALDARLAPLAAAAAGAQAAAEAAQAASTSVSGRLVAVEARLEGTENLAGRGIAVDRYGVAAGAVLRFGGVVDRVGGHLGT